MFDFLSDIFGGNSGSVAPSGQMPAAQPMAPPVAPTLTAEPQGVGIFNMQPRRANIWAGAFQDAMNAMGGMPGGNLSRAMILNGNLANDERERKRLAQVQQQFMVPGAEGSATRPPQNADELMQGILRAGAVDPEYFKQYPTMMNALRQLQEARRPQAPKQFTRNEGGQTITERWDPLTGTMRQIATAPRWNPNQRGMSVTAPDGTVISFGGMPSGAGELTKSNRNKVQETLGSTRQQLDQLESMRSLYKPEFLKWGTQADNYISGLMEKAGMDVEMSPQEREDYEQYNQFVVTGKTTLQEYVKAMSGATVTDKERADFRASFPNEDMSPSRYKAAWDSAHDKLAKVQVRKYLADKYGMHISMIPLTGRSTALNKLIDKELESYEAQMMKSMSPEDAEQAALEWGASIFGAFRK